MAKTDYSSIVIPSSPKDRVIIARCLQEFVDSKTRVSGEAALQKDIKKRIKDSYNIPSELVTQWVADLMDPEQRQASEAKFEAIEAGRVAFIDQNKSNLSRVNSGKGDKDIDVKFDKPATKPVDTNAAKELLDDLAGFVDTNEVESGDEFQQLIEDEPLVIDPIKETPPIEEPAKKAPAKKAAAKKAPVKQTEPEKTVTDDIDIQLDTKTVDIKTEPFINTAELDDLELDDLFDELVVDTKPKVDEKSQVIADDELDDMFAESGKGLGDSPTNEDFEAVSKAAEASAAELDSLLDDEFSNLAVTLDTPITKDTVADLDDTFAGLEEFDTLVNNNTPTAEAKKAPVVDDDLDALFDSL